MKGKRIDHVGIVVDDLESASAFVRDVLGFDFDRKLSIAGRLNAIFFRCGDAGVELIEVTDPLERQNRLGSALAKLEHVAVEVDDVAAVQDTLRRSGVEMTSPTAAIAGPIRSFFTRPETTKGVVYQLFDRRVPSTTED